MKLIYSCGELASFSGSAQLAAHCFDSNAIKVFQRLRRFRHTAYFVGGCIRDLLLGLPPKDFDIVTSAKPKEIRRIFKNSRIIGRRFLLVHVIFGKKIIEVATFRRAPSEDEKIQRTDGLQQDNFFGTHEEDVLRRDFTINALYYNPEKNVVIDYVGGLADLQNRKIRTIGDPRIRFQEDPVRMVRALKLASQLKFDMVPEIEMAIGSYANLLEQTSRARLLLEMIKILQSGAALPCLHRMAGNGVLAILSPSLYKIWTQPELLAYKVLEELLQHLDQFSTQTRQNFSEETLLAVLCYPLVAAKKQRLKRGESLGDSLCKKYLTHITAELSISKKMLDIISKLICVQGNFDKMSYESDKKLVMKSYFPEAFDFLHIRTYHDKNLYKLYNYWRKCRTIYGRQVKQANGE